MSNIWKENNDKTKLVALAIKQDLFLWEITKSFLDIEEKIEKSMKYNV